MVGQRDGVRHPRLRRLGLLHLIWILPTVGLVAWWLFWPRGSSESGIVAEAVSSTGVVVGSDAVAEGSSEKHPLDPVLDLAHASLKSIQAGVEDYRTRMVKRERIRGRLGDESIMQVKFRVAHDQSDQMAEAKRGHGRTQVYLRFESPSNIQGREVIWIEGRNDDKMIAHEAGLLNLIRTELDPNGPLAMMGNKYPITEIGLEKMVQKLIEIGQRERERDDCQVLIEEGHRVGDRVCRLIQVTHPKKQPDLEFHVAQIFFDVERMVPLRYASYQWPDGDGEPPLEEEYTFLDLQLNVGLSDRDFDPDNPEYDFP